MEVIQWSSWKINYFIIHLANFSCYPNYIFSTLDHRKSGVINFEVIDNVTQSCQFIYWLLKDFAIGLSILLKGSDEDKLKWIFHLYDVNKDGVLTIDEFREVVTSVSNEHY